MAFKDLLQSQKTIRELKTETAALRLEKAEITGTVTVSFIRETYGSPDPVRCRDPHRRAECRRCDRLGRGKKSGLESEMSQRGQQKLLDHLHDGGRFAADAVHRPQKGQ